MGSRKMLKFAFCEVVQFVGLCVPSSSSCRGLPWSWRWWKPRPSLQETAARPTGWSWPPRLPTSPPQPCWSGFPWSTWSSLKRSFSSAEKSGESFILVSADGTPVLTQDLTRWFESKQMRGWFELHLTAGYRTLVLWLLPYLFVFSPFCLSVRRPVALVYVVLSTLPCFAFLIASSEVHVIECCLIWVRLFNLELTCKICR